MHRLVQLSTRKWLESQGQLGRWRGPSLRLLCLSFPWPDDHNLPICQQLFPHAEVAAARCPKDKALWPDWTLILFCAAHWAATRYKIATYEIMAHKIIVAKRILLAEDDWVIVDSIRLLTQALIIQKNYIQAEKWARQGLNICDKLYGRQHPSTLNCLFVLSISLEMQGKYQEAIDIAKEVFKAREKLPGKEHRDMLASLYQVSRLLSVLGYSEQAEKVVRGTLAIFQERDQGDQDTETADTFETLRALYILATVLLRGGKLQEGEVTLRRSLAGTERLVGKDHERTFDIGYGLGTVLVVQGKNEEALGFYQKAYDGRVKLYGEEDPICQDYLHVFQKLLSRTLPK